MRKWLLLILLSGLLVLSGSGTAGAEPKSACDPAALKDAEVISTVWITYDGKDFPRAESDMVVKVPKSWPLAGDLLLNGDAERYRTAMRCLMRQPDDTHPFRYSEWRPEAPEATVGEKAITVRYRAVSQVDSADDHTFGTWRITAGHRLWSLVLEPPQALSQSWWRQVTVDLGGRGGRDISPMPTTGTATHLTWTWARSDMPIPEVRVRMQPPATKSILMRWGDGLWERVAVACWVSWDMLFLPVALAVSRRLSLSPGPATESPAQAATRRDLRLWAWLVFFAAPIFELTWSDDGEVTSQVVSGVLGGVVLTWFGRPRAAAQVTVAAAGVYCVVVANHPEWFGLPHDFWLDQNYPDEVATVHRSAAFCWIALVAVCLAFVWLVGTVSVVQRFRAGARVQLAGTRLRGEFPRWVLPGCAFAAVILVGLDLWATHNGWGQWTWLSVHDDYWSRWRFVYNYNQLLWFAADWTGWFSFLCWWYGAIGVLLAALAARAAAFPRSFSPRGATMLLLVVFSFQVAWPVPATYIGLRVPWLTVPVTVLAGFLLLTTGRRRAVLWQVLLPGIPLRAAVRESDRTWLIESARTYRDLHSQLRRLEQGDQSGERADLERKLDDLHHWNPRGATAPFEGAALPDSVDAVELALAWGPRASWWQNACRAALFSAVLALPATGILLWATKVRGPLWEAGTKATFGMPELLTYVIDLEIHAAGVGFILGALWRVLPGRRGPAKALGLFLVYAAPVTAHWIITRAVGQTFGTWALELALMLLVLTSVGVAMDIDTFRQEGIYWPTKASLLLSIYQLRTASVQLAFFVAQVVALVGVWQQLKGNDPMVLIQPSSAGTDQSGSAGH